jgi:putative oxidoreductase
MSRAQVSSALPFATEDADASATPRALVLIARVLFSLIFILAAVGHFSSQTIGFAAAQGVPLASLAVPLSGVLSLAGGLSVLIGYRARWGALALIVFLVPVTLMMHAFWAQSDPMMKQMHLAMFMKNVALIGGALLIYVYGAGPLSLDNRRARAA